MTGTFADKLFAHLAQVAKDMGLQRLPTGVWLMQVNAFFDKECPKRKRKSNVLGKGLTDEEWHTELEANPDLDGVDVPLQAKKCRLHFSSRGIVPSRARFMRWLANADRTLPMGQRKSVRFNDVYKEPASDLWRQAAKRRYPGTQIGESNWFDLGTDMRSEILKEMNK